MAEAKKKPPQRRKFNALERPERFTNIIARELRSRIESRELLPNDRLPSEHALAAEFEVSRPVVREAISQLKYDGVVETRPGSGAFVADLSQRTAFRITSECFEKRSELVKILELQGTVGSDAARLAALNRSERQHARMQKALKLMNEALEKGPHGIRQWLDAEYQLYVEIAQASGNSFFVEFLGIINNRIKMKLEIAALNNVRVAEFTHAVLAEHVAVVAKIEQQDAEGAANKARVHFTNASARTSARGDLRD